MEVHVQPHHGRCRQIVSYSLLSINSLPDAPFAESTVLSNEFIKSNEWRLREL